MMLTGCRRETAYDGRPKSKAGAYRLLRWVLAQLVLTGSWLLVPSAAAAQTVSCQYVLGFATLAQLVPEVGGCLDNQAAQPNGDAVQHSARGLLAWRKVDNWTAFTDGYRTWINGPQGLQSRLNNERFAWEADVPPTVATPSSPSRCSVQDNIARQTYADQAADAAVKRAVEAENARVISSPEWQAAVNNPDFIQGRRAFSGPSPNFGDLESVRSQARLKALQDLGSC